jgi:hypothetical protein
LEYSAGIDVATHAAKNSFGAAKWYEQIDDIDDAFTRAIAAQ